MALFLKYTRPIFLINSNLRQNNDVEAAVVHASRKIAPLNNRVDKSRSRNGFSINLIRNSSQLNRSGVRKISTLNDTDLKNFLLDDEIHDIPGLYKFTSKLLYNEKNIFHQTGEVYKSDMPSIPPQLRYWFRGHACKIWGLQPTIHRYEESNTSGYLEKGLLTSFQLNHSEHSVESHNLLRTLSTMQHYGYPTRLLDWTGNIMNAAYFACVNRAHDDSDGLIWILDPFALNLKATITQKMIGIALVSYFDVQIRLLQTVCETVNELLCEHSKTLVNSTELPRKFIENKSVSTKDMLEFIESVYEDKESRKRLMLPIAVEPGSLNPRISVQKGKFTVGSGKQYYSREKSSATGLKLFDPPQSLISNNDYLKCVVVKSEAKPLIRRELRDIMGIDESSMMLDLDYHGKAASNIYSYNRRK